MKGPTEEIQIRRLETSDSLEELTEILHRAYKRLADQGFNYTAVDQPVEVTRRRIDGCECFVAVQNGKLVGTVNLDLRLKHSHPWAEGRTDVAFASQLAVEPELRKTGLGSCLMDVAENRAREAGFSYVVGDTSEGAHELIKFYSRRGYEIVEHIQRRGKNYRSVVLAKKL